MNKQRFHLHLKSVVDSDFCREIIRRATIEGFDVAGVSDRAEDMPRIRTGEKASILDNILPAKIEAVLRKAAGESFPYKVDGCRYSKIGNLFKVYRYIPGNFFKPHKDGSTLIGVTQLSKVTVLCYLSDVDGGETLLMPDGYAGKDSWIRILPRAGDVLMFERDIWHEEKPVLSGEKYVLRLDLYYQIPG